MSDLVKKLLKDFPIDNEVVTSEKEPTISLTDKMRLPKNLFKKTNIKQSLLDVTKTSKIFPKAIEEIKSEYIENFNNNIQAFNEIEQKYLLKNNEIIQTRKREDRTELKIVEIIKSLEAIIKKETRNITEEDSSYFVKYAHFLFDEDDEKSKAIMKYIESEADAERIDKLNLIKIRKEHKDYITIKTDIAQSNIKEQQEINYLKKINETNEEELQSQLDDVREELKNLIPPEKVTLSEDEKVAVEANKEELEKTEKLKEAKKTAELKYEKYKTEVSNYNKKYNELAKKKASLEYDIYSKRNILIKDEKFEDEEEETLDTPSYIKLDKRIMTSKDDGSRGRKTNILSFIKEEKNNEALKEDKVVLFNKDLSKSQYVQDLVSNIKNKKVSFKEQELMKVSFHKTLKYYFDESEFEEVKEKKTELALKLIIANLNLNLDEDILCLMISMLLTICLGLCLKEDSNYVEVDEINLEEQNDNLEKIERMYNKVIEYLGSARNLVFLSVHNFIRFNHHYPAGKERITKKFMVGLEQDLIDKFFKGKNPSDGFADIFWKTIYVAGKCVHERLYYFLFIKKDCFHILNNEILHFGVNSDISSNDRIVKIRSEPMTVGYLILDIVKLMAETFYKYKLLVALKIQQTFSLISLTHMRQRLLDDPFRYHMSNHYFKLGVSSVDVNEFNRIVEFFMKDIAGIVYLFCKNGVQSLKKALCYRKYEDLKSPEDEQFMQIYNYVAIGANVDIKAVMEQMKKISATSIDLPDNPNDLNSANEVIYSNLTL